MVSTTSCSLCSFACCQFKHLYDYNGEASAVYNIAGIYFSSSVLDAEVEPNLRVICLECWQHITDFYSFQQWILNAQTQQKELAFIEHYEKTDKQVADSCISDLNDNPTESKLTLMETGNYSSSEMKGEFKYNESKDLCESYVALDADTNKILNSKINDGQAEEANFNFEYPQSRRREDSFKCKICGALFSQYGNLRRHIRKKHMVEPPLKWICKNCNKMFKTRLNLEKHKSKLHNYQCSDNLESYITQNIDKERIYDRVNYDSKEVKMNKILNENENDSVAEKCHIEQLKVTYEQKHFRQSYYNTRSSTKESSDNNFMKLDVVAESTSTEVNCNMQIQMPALHIIDVKAEEDADSDEPISEKEETYEELSPSSNGELECPRCNHHVKNYYQLNEHFHLEHPEERSYIICCHITLYDRQTIEEHMQFHENPYAFKCSDCSKCFNNRKGLNSHKLQVHRDNRSTYHLHLCNCNTAKKLYAENIAKGKQTEYDTFVCCQRKRKILENDALIARWNKKLTCEVCKASFPYYSIMRQHFYYEHPGEKCYIFCCERKMSRFSDALEHVRFHLDPHAYRCKVCNLDFSGKNTLTKHMRNAHIDSLPKHRWACDECDKTFEIRQVLTRHKNVVHSKQV